MSLKFSESFKPESFKNPQPREQKDPVIYSGYIRDKPTQEQMLKMLPEKIENAAKLAFDAGLDSFMIDDYYSEKHLKMAKEELEKIGWFCRFQMHHMHATGSYPSLSISRIPFRDNFLNI